MPFAANTILLKNIPLSYLDGRLILNGTGLSFVNEGSAPSNVVFTTGDQTISGRKIFAGYLDAGNRYLISSNGYNVLDWEDRVLSEQGSTKLDWVANEVYGVWTHTGVATSSGHIVNYGKLTDYAYPKSNPSGYFNRSGTSILYATYGGSYPSVDLDQGILYTNYYNTSGQSVDYNGMNLYNGKTGPERKLRANWDAAELYDNNESQSIIWMDRQLTTSTGFSDVALDWENKIISGDWQTDTKPTSSGHIINKGYLDSYSEMVRTFGDQNIIGGKVFYSLGESLDYYPSLDIENQKLLHNHYSATYNRYHSGAVINWRAGVLGWSEVGPYDSIDYPRISLESGILYKYNSPDSLAAIKLDSSELFDGTNTKIDWENDRLYSYYNYQHYIAFDWKHSKIATGAEASGGVVFNGFESKLYYTGAESLNWAYKNLVGNWQIDTVPTTSGHIINKGYCDSNSIYSIQFGHASLIPTDSTTYYFGGAFSDLPGSVQATSPVMVVPTSGVLRKIVGNASIMTTLSTAETISMIVYLNNSPIATGSYNTTGYNNKIFSGLSSINRNVNALDTLQLGMSCPAWTVNPIGANNSLIAQISLG